MPTPAKRAHNGWKKDNADPRDKRLAALVGLPPPPPPSSDGLRAYVAALLDQRDGEGCVGWSTTQAIWTRWNMLEALAGRPQPVAQPSPLFTWFNARVATGDADQNDGTYIRDAVKQLIKIGIAPESAWPSTDPGADYANKPPQLVYQSAFDQLFPIGYYRISDDPAQRKLQVMQAIAAGYPVVFGTLVTNDFLQLGAHGPLPIPPEGSTFAGGHAMPILAYDQQGVMGPNSWQDKAEGILWGNDGWFYLSWDYLLWSETNDLWAIDVGPAPEGWGATLGA